MVCLFVGFNVLPYLLRHSSEGVPDAAPQYSYYRAAVPRSSSSRIHLKAFSLKDNYNSRPQADRQVRATSTVDMAQDVPYGNFSKFIQSFVILNKGFGVRLAEERVGEGVEVNRVRSLSSGFWTLLVPANNFTDYVQDLKALGRMLRFQTMSVSVEESSINVEMELKLATANLKRLEAIAAEAKTLEEKLKVNALIKDAEREVKMYEFANHGQEKSVEYSRVNLDVQELESERPSNDERYIGKLLLALLLLFVSGLLLICCVFRPNDIQRRLAQKMMRTGDRHADAQHESFSSSAKDEKDHPEEVSLLVGFGTRSDSDGFNFVEKQ